MKKKMLLLLLSILMSVGNAVADDISVAEVSVPQGGKSQIAVVLTNPEKVYTAGQMLLTLPDGVAAVLNGSGEPEMIKGERFNGTNHGIGASHMEDGSDQFTIFSINSSAIPNSSGELFYVLVQADESLEVGTTLTGRLSGIEMTTTNGEQTLFNDQTFTITITEPADPWLTLDEDATEVPEATDGDVDIKVVRSIKANEWSTLCLPFEMTESQVKEAFGEDVQLAEFIDYEVNDDATEIKVNFEDANLAEGLLANYPYIIRTTQDVEEFMVTATIEPDEENAVAEYAEGRGARRHVYGTFYGTLHAGMMVPENCLFLSENKFWYSVGKTPMKAFRAYFELEDVLADRQNAKVSLNFGNSVPTGIGHAGSKIAEEGLYDLQGRRAYKDSRRLKSGIYVSKNKKVVVK